MAAKIKGFVTRAEAGLRNPRSYSRNVTPQRGGCVTHWGGTRTGISRTTGHDKCVAIWRAWQKYHMDTRGWTDLAYNGGYCNHGYAFAGRGLGVRSAANGTNDGNQNYYAFVWIGGDDDFGPTRAAFDALEWWIREARQEGDAGHRVRPHTAFTGSACPGPKITERIKRLDDRSIPDTRPRPVLREGSRGRAVRELQRRLNRVSGIGGDLKVDGDFNGVTERVVRKFQRKHKLKVDGVVGPATWRRLIRLTD